MLRLSQMRGEEKRITASRAPIQQANQAAKKLAIQSVFDIAAFLASGAVSKLMEFSKKQKLFSQGDPASHVFYIQEGSVRLAVARRRQRGHCRAARGWGFFG